MTKVRLNYLSFADIVLIVGEVSATVNGLTSLNGASTDAVSALIHTHPASSSLPLPPGCAWLC